MERSISCKILFTNIQWMLQSHGDGMDFMVEIDRKYPDDMGGCYWLTARDLTDEHVVRNLLSKNWVDLSACEEALSKALIIFAATPKYDVRKLFDEVEQSDKATGIVRGYSD